MHNFLCLPLFIDENHEFCEFLRHLGDRNGSRDHISILKCKVSKINSETKKIILSKRRNYPKHTILNANMPENDSFQFMGNSVYEPLSLPGVFRNNSVVFYYNPICLLSTSLSYKIINKSNHSLSISPLPPLPLQRRQSRRKQLFELRVNSLHLEQ